MSTCEEIWALYDSCTAYKCTICGFLVDRLDVVRCPKHLAPHCDHYDCYEKCKNDKIKVD